MPNVILQISFCICTNCGKLQQWTSPYLYLYLYLQFFCICIICIFPRTVDWLPATLSEKLTNCSGGRTFSSSKGRTCCQKKTSTVGKKQPICCQNNRKIGKLLICYQTGKFGEFFFFEYFSYCLILKVVESFSVLRFF